MPEPIFRGVAKEDHPAFGKNESCRPHELEVYDEDGWFIWRCPDCGMSATGTLSDSELEAVRAGKGQEVFGDELA